MNFYNVFEDRAEDVLAEASQETVPFSFKKLAHEAAKQLKKETYQIDGQSVAPGLFTILVSPEAARQLMPVYRQIVKELTLFLRAQADRKGIRFLTDPVVRFMPDQELKRARFFVFAENIDPVTLDKVRVEEAEFLTQAAQQSTPSKRSHASSSRSRKKNDAQNSQEKEGTPRSHQSNASSDDGFEEGLDLTPQPQKASQPGISSTPLVSNARVARAHDLQKDDGTPRHAAPRKPVIEALLVDRHSGKTYPVTAPSLLIGRQAGGAAIALDDPNVSRRHAEITYEHGLWMIVDLNSTNGTLVNNEDITEVSLHDGDIITVGLTNLEFRED